MGSVCDVKKCGTCSGLLHTDYRYRTGEHSNFCVKCGQSSSVFIQKDEKGNWVRTDTEYPLDGLTILGVRSGETLVWEMPITSDMTVDEIIMFLNEKNDDAPAWMPNFSKIKGHRSIFRKEADGQLKQLMYIGNWFRFQTDENAIIHFYLEEAVWDTESADGNGVINVSETNGCSSLYCVGNKTKAEVIAICEDIRKMERPFDTSTDYVTFREPDTCELICLYGKMPESFDEFCSSDNSDVLCFLEKENVKVTWEYIGEGLCGDYNPEDDDDIRLLRFYVYSRDDETSEWECVEYSSYCTNLQLDTSKSVMEKGLQMIMDAVFEKVRNNESIKKICERLSHIDEMGIATNNNYLK